MEVVRPLILQLLMRIFFIAFVFFPLHGSTGSNVQCASIPLEHPRSSPSLLLDPVEFPPLIIDGQLPSSSPPPPNSIGDVKPPNASPEKAPVNKYPITKPRVPAVKPIMPGALPRKSGPRGARNKSPTPKAVAPAPAIPPGWGSPESSPAVRPMPIESPSLSPDHRMIPVNTPSPSINGKTKGTPVAAAPPLEPAKPLPVPHSNHSPNKGRLHAPSSSRLPSSKSHVSPALSPSGSPASESSPSWSSSRNPAVPHLPAVRAFPPPPNKACSRTVCTEPYTNTPPGLQCGCVRPMQVGLGLSVPLYTFFPLLSEFAEEIAGGVFMKQSQIRIVGANAAAQEPDKTVVLIDLLPLGEKFDNTSAFLTYRRFWHKRVAVKSSLFGDYGVLYVRYPGLPSSPPSTPLGEDGIDDKPYSGKGDTGMPVKPLGVDVHNSRHSRKRLSGGVITVIVLAASVVIILCFTIAWVLRFRKRDCHIQSTLLTQPPAPSLLKPSGSTRSIMANSLNSASLSFISSLVPYAGSAKTFSASDIERATANFDASRVLGEGGFGRVYRGVFDDGTEVAVKVLKRVDQQGGREFLAEVEMLSRLHHRNLVKLFGICTEEQCRCLVYELVHNGSVESHLHGVDKESAPLNCDARLKIALGAARGLAYLHEDSSLRVIHRDFKSSNILLEDDYTPKISDFGLACAAADEDTGHISTRVMGTFGYVAPEYAMTGHLLVKSDVYSYGVVLLELLTGRKPIDMSESSRQGNLVAWARPFLTSKGDLEMIIDPSLGPNIPFDAASKVAAIASMCVQPEVSHRPFMGEVVQALKLVCNEYDEAKELGLISCYGEDFSVETCAGVGTGAGFVDCLSPSYGSEFHAEEGLSVSNMLSASARLERQASGSFRRHSSSGPSMPAKSRQFWQRINEFPGGSVSDHVIGLASCPGSD